MDDSVYYPHNFSRQRPRQAVYVGSQHPRSSNLKSGDGSHGRANVGSASATRHIPAAVERMRHRSERLKTFSKWPLYASVGPVDLAQAGFYYMGEKDKVKCFSCGCIVHQWAQGDKPLAEHQRISPLCRFLEVFGELPVSKPLKDPRMIDERNRLGSFRNWPLASPVRPEDLARAGFYYTGSADKVQCFSCQGAIHKWENGDDALQEHRKFFPDCDFIGGRDTSNIPINPNPQKIHTEHGFPISASHHEPWHKPIEAASSTNRNSNSVYCLQGLNSALPSAHPSVSDFNYESMRVESFQAATWQSANVPVSEPLLAQAGFFYTGIGNIVECFCCHIKLSDWKVGHSPFEEHQKVQPRCPFVQGVDADNIHSRLPVMAGNTSRALGMRSITERLASFSRWPTSHSVKAVKLAEAGFYYAGNGDSVICCSCGITVSDWRQGDKPEIEHQKHKQDCPYLNLYFPDKTHTTGARMITQATDSKAL